MYYRTAISWQRRHSLLTLVFYLYWKTIEKDPICFIVINESSIAQMVKWVLSVHSVHFRCKFESHRILLIFMYVFGFHGVNWFLFPYFLVYKQNTSVLYKLTLYTRLFPKCQYSFAQARVLWGVLGCFHCF